MFGNTKKLMLKRLLRILGATVVNAFLGLVCGGLYGLVFGGMRYMARAEVAQLLVFVAAFSVCGAMAAALIGVRELLPDTTEPTLPSSDSPLDLVAGQSDSPAVRRRIENQLPLRTSIQIAS